MKYKLTPCKARIVLRYGEKDFQNFQKIDAFLVATPATFPFRIFVHRPWLRFGRRLDDTGWKCTEAITGLGTGIKDTQQEAISDAITIITEHADETRAAIEHALKTRGAANAQKGATK